MTKEDRPDSNSKKAAFAAVIVIFAVAVPAYFLRSTPWDNFEPGLFTIGVPILYFVIIVGFVSFVFGHRGRNVVSKDAEEKLSRFYKKYVTPIYWTLMVGLVLYIAYLSIQIWWNA